MIDHHPSLRNTFIAGTLVALGIVAVEKIDWGNLSLPDLSIDAASEEYNCTPEGGEVVTVMPDSPDPVYDRAKEMSHKYGFRVLTALDILAQTNPGTNINSLHAGQVFTVPVCRTNPEQPSK